MISAASWRAWCDACDAVCGAASEAVERAVLAWCGANPGATAAEAREAAKAIMARAVPNADGVASSLAARLYDAAAGAAGADLPQAVTCAVYRPEKADEVARYQVRKFAESPAAFARACGEYAWNDAALAVNETVMRNAARDGGRGVRFARVTSGRETCAFCLMLAGRGAVYYSRKTAGESRHFHRGCRCKVVPGFGDDPDAELVEGHSPKASRAAYLRCKGIDALGLPREQADALKMVACKEAGLAVNDERGLADALGEAVGHAAKELKARGKTIDAYESTVGRFLGLLGEQCGSKVSGSWTRSANGGYVFAVPDGDELWLALNAMRGEKVTFLPQDRGLTPDVRTANGHVEFKTSKSARKVANRLKHASEQLAAAGDAGGTVYLSLLRLESDERAAVETAQRFVDDGSIRELRVVRADGTVEALKKKDAGLGS